MISDTNNGNDKSDDDINKNNKIKNKNKILW